MPRTQVPEEGQRVVNVSELKNTKPRSEAVIRTEGKNVTNDGLSNLYWWDPNGNPSNADGETIIESSVSGYQNGEVNEGVWRRMFVPSSQLSGNGLSYRSSDQKLDVRLPIDQGGSNVTSAYSFNYTSVFELIDDGSGQVTIGLNQGDSSGLNADTLDGVELADISFSDIAAEKYTDEEAQDAVGNIVSGGTDITTTYDDPNNAVTINHANTGAADSTNSGSTVLQSLTSDGRGHVETISTATFSAGDGLSLNGTTFNTRLDIDESGSNVTSAYAFNFSTDINVIDDGGNQVTVKHADTGSASSTNSGETVIQSLSSDNRGHVETISTKTLSAGEGLSFSSGSFDVRLDIDDSGSNVTTAYALNFGSDINVIDDGSNQVTVSVDSNSFTSAAGNAGAVQYSDGNGEFLGNTGYLYIDNSDGSVGVGTSSPAENFSVDGNVGVKSGYLWIKNDNNAYVTGSMHVGGSSVPANALEISGNFTSSGWGGVNDKFSVNAPTPYGPNAVGTEELQVDGSVGADSYNFYHPDSSWNIRPSGGQGDLLIHQNFGSNFSLIEARTRDVDVTDTSTDSEATLALTRSDSAETAAEFLDLYNNGYYSSGSVRHGLRVQKRGGGKLRDFDFEWDDGNNQYLGYSIKPPTDLTNGDGAKIHFNVPIGILTASPSYVLDVNGDINAQGELRSSGNIVSPDSDSDAHHTRPSAGDGIADNSNTFDVRLDIDEEGANVTTAYGINFGSNIDVIDDGSNKVTVDVDTASLAAAAGSAGAVQYASSSGDFLGNTSYLYVDDSNGNVGINTNSPTSRFEVVGNIKTVGGLFWSSRGDSGIARSARLENYNDTNNKSGADIGVKLSGTEFQGLEWQKETAWTSSSNSSEKDVQLQLGVLQSGSEVSPVTIRSTGNVGIGTSSPGEKLSVNGNLKVVGTGSSAKINIGKSGAYPQSIQMANGFSVFETTSANLIQINKGSWGKVSIPSGDVGIGTTTPSYKLDVNGDVNISSSLEVGGDATVSGALNVQGFTFDQDSGDFVLSNSSGVELIRQPEDGSTQFVQGAEIDSIVAPEDSFTQMINASSTSAASSGDPVGYTFAIDNQSVLEIKAEADGSGGITNKTVNFPSEILEGGDGLVSNSGKLDVRLDINEGGSNVTTAYGLNFGSGINVVDDGSNQVTISVDSGAFTSAAGNQGAVQYSDGNGEFLGNENYLYVDDSNGNIGIGTSSPSKDFSVNGDASIGKSLNVQDFTFDQDSGNFVLLNNNGVELIRQPVDGTTKFVQGAEINSIKTPKDSFTQLINAATTNAASSGDPVGYTFAINNQSVFEVKADADGSGGITNKRINFPGGIFGGGDGLVLNSGTLNVRLDIDDNNSDVTTAYGINFGSNLNVIDDGSNKVTVEHADSSDQQNVSTSGATIIKNINVDDDGHVTNINTENRTLDQWDPPASSVDFGSQDILNFAGGFGLVEDNGDLVLEDSNGINLIRQPKGGSTQFVQGAEIDSIVAPEDSFTQMINASSTSAANFGSLVGYTFAVNNQAVLEVKADADGNGGITNKRVDFPNDVGASFGNFDIQYNSNSESLDFVYIK